MSDSDVTILLQRLSRGDGDAKTALLDAVYAELKRMAAGRMRSERPDHTLQPTALVHEAYLRLIGSGPVQWQNRSHFFAVAAQAMRRILVDHARARNADKRGGDAEHLPLIDAPAKSESDPVEILALDHALSRLEEEEPDVAMVVNLRFFAGLSGEQTAEVLSISPRQVDRLWAYARAKLYRAQSE